MPNKHLLHHLFGNVDEQLRTYFVVSFVTQGSLLELPHHISHRVLALVLPLPGL